MNKNYYMILVMLFLGISCVYDVRYGLTIKNKSNSKIYIYKTCSDSILLKPHFKISDTIFIKNKRIIYDYSIKPNSVNSFAFFERERYYIRCKNKYINVFVINSDALIKYGWSGVVEKQLYEKKLTYTFKELDSLNWLIEYE